MKEQDPNVFEIDILYLIKTLFRKKLHIILAAFVGAGIAFVYSFFIATPMYDSVTRIYVVNQSNQGNVGLTNQDLQAGTYLVKDYKEIILSQDVLSRVSEELGTTETTETIRNKVSVEIPVDTRIVSITVRDDSPEEAARIANTLRQIAAQKIIDVTKVNDVTTLEEATPALHPSSPNIRRNVILGVVIGAGLAIAIILVMEVLDDRVKRPEDIEEMLGLPLLGVVPDTNKLK